MQSRRTTPPSFVIFALAAGLLFVLGGIVTAASPSARALWIASAVAFVGVGTYTMVLLVRSNRLVEELDEVESELAASRTADTGLRVRMAHTLRDPLTSIVGLTDRMLNDSGITAQERSAMLREMRSGAREVEAVLADLAADEASGDSPSSMKGVVLLDEELASIVAMTRGSTVFRADLAPARAWGDSATVRQILRTIVATAVSSDSEEVDVTTEQRSGLAVATLSCRNDLLPPAAVAALTGNVERSDALDARFIALREARDAAARMGGSIGYAQALGRSHIIAEFEAVDAHEVGLRPTTSRTRVAVGAPSPAPERDPNLSFAMAVGMRPERPTSAIRFG